MATKRTDKTRDAEITTPGKLEAGEGTPDSARKSVKPRHFRKKAQEEIGKSYTAIVKTLANKAARGSVQHTKLLFDLGGVKEEVQASATGRRRRPRSLGEILLKEAEALKRNKEIEAPGGETK
ncbi:MAG TPA: hypothetical protein VKH40_11570 [Alloacidobacterium sp.]|nr:hypothetical protein [Alloacidobacterium sp.]